MGLHQLVFFGTGPLTGRFPRLKFLDPSLAELKPSPLCKRRSPAVGPWLISLFSDWDDCAFKRGWRCWMLMYSWQWWSNILQNGLLPLNPFSPLRLNLKLHLLQTIHIQRRLRSAAHRAEKDIRNSGSIYLFSPFSSPTLQCIVSPFPQPLMFGQLALIKAVQFQVTLCYVMR